MSPPIFSNKEIHGLIRLSLKCFYSELGRRSGTSKKMSRKYYLACRWIWGTCLRCKGLFCSCSCYNVLNFQIWFMYGCTSCSWAVLFSPQILVVLCPGKTYTLGYYFCVYLYKKASIVCIWCERFSMRCDLLDCRTVNSSCLLFMYWRHLLINKIFVWIDGLMTC